MIFRKCCPDSRTYSHLPRKTSVQNYFKFIFWGEDTSVAKSYKKPPVKSWCPVQAPSVELVVAPRSCGCIGATEHLDLTNETRKLLESKPTIVRI